MIRDGLVCSSVGHGGIQLDVVLSSMVRVQWVRRAFLICLAFSFEYFCFSFVSCSRTITITRLIVKRLIMFNI